MPGHDDVNTDEREAELAIARVRDTLGWSNDHLEASERILARVLNHVEDDDTPREHAETASADTSPPVVQSLRAARRRRWPILAAAAAAVALLAVGLQGLGPQAPALASPPHLTFSLAEPQDATTAPSARQVLTELAQAARSTPAPGTGEVMFTRSYGWYEWGNMDTRESVIAPIAFASWVAPNGSGLTEQHTGPFLRADGTIDPDPGRERQEISGDTFGPGEGAFATYPDTLPLDPDALRDTLLEPWATPLHSDTSSRAALLIDEVNSLSMLYVLDGDTAASLWDMLAGEEAVVTLGETRDRIGRSVVAIASPPIDNGAGPSVRVLLADPVTGRLVGNEIVALSSPSLDGTEPTVTGFTTIIDSRLVETVGATP